jgi:hypothetical protein
VKYKHGISKSLVKCLYKLQLAGGGPLNISDSLDLSKGQYTNFAKLQYWGFIEHANPNHSERGGYWVITPKGYLFLQDKLTVTRFAWVYRGDVVERTGPDVGVKDVTGGWHYRPQYARDARPHGPQNDLPLNH